MSRSRSPQPSPARTTGPARAAGPDPAVALALALACAYVLAFVIVAVARLPYPFELEWLEGVVLEHVHRVLAGQPIYVAPSVDFVPLNYTPLYYYVSAAFAAALGPGFVALRLVSLL